MRSLLLSLVVLRVCHSCSVGGGILVRPLARLPLLPLLYLRSRDNDAYPGSVDRSFRRLYFLICVARLLSPRPPTRLSHLHSHPKSAPCSGVCASLDAFSETRIHSHQLQCSMPKAPSPAPTLATPRQTHPTTLCRAHRERLRRRAIVGFRRLYS